MVERITNASRDRTGIEVPQSQQEVRGAADLGGRADKVRKGSAPLWGAFGATFRKREAGLYQRVESAAKLTEGENPEGNKYENSQRLLDYLSGKAEPSDPELKAEIAELRKEVPTLLAKESESHDHLDSGSEADVRHDTDNGVVYKLYNAKDGKLGGYVPEDLRLRRDNEITVSAGERPTFPELIERRERSNSHGAEWNAGCLRMENWGGPSATDKRRYIEALKQG
jgi:hypothetical protein